MPLIINTNVASLNAQRNLGTNSANLNKSLERLSSGLKINRSGDDAAGLQISELFRAQIRGQQKAVDNTQDGLNLLNLADGSYQTISDNLQRIRELTVQAANDTNATAQRTAIEGEVDQLRSDIDRIASATTFNGNILLGSATPANLYIQVGSNNNSFQDRIDLASGLGNTSTGTSGLNLSAASGQLQSNGSAQTYLGTVDAALSALNAKRSTLGALANRLQSASANASVKIENLSAAESRIRNVDVAAESANLTRNQILQQASASILSQANQSSQLALKLIG
ncbi:MAG: flagellin FliC [Cyanobacteria bacterium]|nr:flagellin FliC [Cyanobacteriota bacterium]